VLAALITDAAGADAAAGVCDGEDEVCLLQLRAKSNAKRQLSARQSSSKKIFGFGDDSSPLDFLAEHILTNHAKPKIAECPGGALVAAADGGVCTHGGIEVKVDFDDEDIEEYFGDNVLMKNWKYFIEGCKLADCQLVNPDVNHHTFHVGKTEIRVEGYDLANNFNKCIRTVYILDRQDPVFTDPQTDLNREIEIYFPEKACTVSGAAAFAEYEEQAGFTGAVTDNCDKEVDVQRKIFKKTGDGDISEIFSGAHGEADMTNYPNLTGPGAWTICYIATDDYAKSHITSAMPFDDEAPGGATALKIAHHCVDVMVSDNTGPYGMKNCPEDKLYIIDPHETEAHNTTWNLPEITGDNCEAFGTIPEAEEQSNPPKYPGMTLPVGSHTVNYALFDSSRNVLDNDECSFTVEVKQLAHPVVLTCPPNVTFQTLPDASFAIVVWEDPVATQGDKILDQSHITYPQGVSFGLPFPFGTTHIKVRADGEITGKRHDEHLQFDECSFSVTVEDPQIPEVDGRLYHCKDDIDKANASFVKPYRVCGGTDLTWTPHPQYIHTHGYDVAGVHAASKECCTDQFDVEHECVPVTTDLVAVEPLASYCKPKPPQPHSGLEEAVTPEPEAPKPEAPKPEKPKSEPCHCVGLPDTLLSNETARKGLPKSYGGECAAHDLTTKSCEGQFKPEWCYESWCYVNPSCDVSDKKETFYFAESGEELFYSYGHCGGLDSFAAEACSEHDAETCESFSSNCVFNIASGACQNKLCQCTGDNLGINTTRLGFSKDYGESCSNWDQASCESWKDEGDGYELGLWCCKDWCYVDPSCPSATASSLKEGLAYSYVACPDDAQDLLQCPWKEPIDFGGEPINLTTSEAAALNHAEEVATVPPVTLLEGETDFCAQFEGTRAHNGCVTCKGFFPQAVATCMGCGGDCARSSCTPGGNAAECVQSEAFEACHLSCMGGGKTNEVLEDEMAACAKFADQGDAVMLNCATCTINHLGAVDECMARFAE